MVVDPADEGPHAGAVDEWGLAIWSPSATIGLVTGHRLDRRSGRIGYWWSLVRADSSLLHVTDWDIVARAEFGIAKGEHLWAEIICEEPFTQWTIGNETTAVALDDPDEALGRCHGDPTPVASDLEWYSAGSSPEAVPGGFAQAGVVHGVIEIGNDASIDLVEWPSRRWHRWTTESPQHWASHPPLPIALAHTGRRAPLREPDGSIVDYVLVPYGWAIRRTVTGADG